MPFYSIYKDDLVHEASDNAESGKISVYILTPTNIEIVYMT